MLDMFLTLVRRYRELVMYLVFGVLTTLVNFAVYALWIWAFPGVYANVSGTCLAWAAAVLFAYVTNRRWVFESRAEGLLPRLRECAAFFASRAASGLIDLGIMYAAVDVMRLDGRVVKLASNILVIIINYILSKFFVFRVSGGKNRL